MRLATIALILLSAFGLAFASAQERELRPARELSGRTFSGSGANLETAIAAAAAAAHQAAQQAGISDFMVEYVVEEIGGRRGGLLNLNELQVRIRLR